MNLKLKNNQKRIFLFTIVVISVIVGVYIAFRLAFFLLPFLIAFALSSLMEPVIRFFTNKLRISRKIVAPVTFLLLLAIILLLAILAVLRLVNEIKNLITVAPGFLSDLYVRILELMNKWSEYIEWMPTEITDNLGSIISNLSNTITSFGKTIVKGAYVTAISLPEAIIFTIITLLATFFMLYDRHKIAYALRRQLPESWINRLLAIKNDLFTAIFGYLRAAMILMVITFTELLIGFSIIGVKYALLLAVIIAVIDALPILGTGGVLIPWSLYSFITGDIRMGVSILILYLVVLIIRQTIEPKVVGQQIGIHPLLTLATMYTGLKLIGFAGLILGPITFIMIRNILKTIYKNKPIKEILSPSAAKNPSTSTGDTAKRK